MRVDDEDAYYDEEVVKGLLGNQNNGDESPEKRALLNGNNDSSISPFNQNPDL
jgi:hypothetical protein